MEPLTYVMALMGCADGGGACTEVRLSEYLFRNRQQCERATEQVLTSSTDIGYPTIGARCVSASHYAASNGKARATLARLQPYSG
jgi:hypothetical protein